MQYDHSTKAQRELNASLRACMKIVKVGVGLYQLHDSTGRVMLSPTSKGNITQWLDRQYPVNVKDLHSLLDTQ